MIPYSKCRFSPFIHKIQILFATSFFLERDVKKEIASQSFNKHQEKAPATNQPPEEAITLLVGLSLPIPPKERMI